LSPWVLLAAWSAIFLVDMWLYRVREGYDAVDLYRPSGRYGAFNLAGLASFVVAAVVGLGLVTSTSPVFSWVGYLLKILPQSTAASLSNSSIGLLIAFVVGGVLYLIISPLQRRAQVSHGPSPKPRFDTH